MVHSFVSEPTLISIPLDLRQALEQLYAERSLHPFSSGQGIHLNHQDIWIVYRGIVQLGTLYDTGDEALLGLACPSMPFGLPLTSIRPHHATALTHVDLMRVTLTEVESSPVLAQSIFRQLNRRLRQTEAMLAMVGYRRVEERLRHFLILLQQEIGQPTEEGTRLSIRLTHQQLANAIGTTRVTITRLLSQLREENWISVDRHRHIILLQSSP
ncbi:MAG: Crp/Fnr family transcriptional regulator [Merismopedia sp. SIO2A8]|nr:Crp/Fnr family transcriptional regulator [Merismopedia sp. SIO2A8]